MEGVVPRRVIVGVSGSSNSLTALRRAAAQARAGGYPLLAVLVWQPSSAGASDAALTAPDSPGAVVAECRKAAVDRLIGVLHGMFGTVGDGTAVEGLVLHGSPGPRLVGAADRDDDLLVVGTGHRGRLRGVRSPVARYCLSRACCPVLAVPPSALQLRLEAMDRDAAARRGGPRLRQDICRRHG